MSAQSRTVSGLKKVAEGREAEMFAWEDGKILRLLRSPEAHWQNEMQAAALRAARASGVPVPAVIEVTTVNGRPGMVMERLDGTDYLTLLGSRIWLIFPIARLSGEMHAQIHAAAGDAELPELRARLRNRIQSTDRLPPHLAAFALDALETLPDGDRLCHGDFHPGNIMRTPNGPAVIDWTNATRGDPDADVARTELMLRVGEPPPGSPVIVRLLARIGGRILLWGYLRSYRRHRKLSKERMARWQVPIAAARVAEGIESELPGLLRFLQRERARAASA